MSMNKVSDEQLAAIRKSAIEIQDAIQNIQTLLACGNMEHAREMLEADIKDMEVKIRKLLYKVHHNKITRSEQSQGKGKPKRIRWETYVGQDMPRIRGNTLEEVEEQLVKYYGLTQILNPSAPHPQSMAGVYPTWIRDRKENTSLAPQTWSRDAYTFMEMLEDDPFAKRDLNRITRKEAQEWLNKKAREHHMDRKKANRFKTLVNALEKYAFANDRVKTKTFSLLTIQPEFLVRKKEIQKEDAIYLKGEIPIFINTAWENYQKLGSRNDGYLASIFNHSFGLRVAELVTIQWTDLYRESNKLHICRHEVEVKELSKDSRPCRSGYRTVDGLKKGVPDRWLPVPPDAWIFLDRIRVEHEQRGVDPDCPWVFVNTEGTDHIHAQNVEKALRLINKVKINGRPVFANKIGGCHEIRRTFASALIDGDKLSRKELQELMGHKHFSTTLTYYDYSGRTIGELGKDVADALCVPLPAFDKEKCS